MKNEITLKDRKTMTNMYSNKFSNYSEILKKYYSEIVENMTLEDANKLLELSKKYDLHVDGDDFRSVFRVVLDYVGKYFKIYNVLSYKKTIDDFNGDGYNHLTGMINYYNGVIDNLKDENSFDFMLVKVLGNDVYDRYFELSTMPLLSSLSNYLVNNTVNIVRATVSCNLNRCIITKNKFDNRKYSVQNLKKYYGLRCGDPHYRSDNH